MIKIQFTAAIEKHELPQLWIKKVPLLRLSSKVDMSLNEEIKLDQSKKNCFFLGGTLHDVKVNELGDYIVCEFDPQRFSHISGFVVNKAKLNE